MHQLEDEIRRLSKIEPPKGFLRQSKKGLMHQVELSKNESVLLSILSKLGMPHPSLSFRQSARTRLMSRIAADLPMRKWRDAFSFLKRALASTMAMLMAVTSTLFFVDGGRTVVADEETYIQVLSGSVSIKHADQLVWDDVTGRVELAAGDLIRSRDGASAVIHFFDDTQIRVDQNSLLLLSQIAVSPVYAQQGIIEVALHEGRAWVQTLNVEDGYAGLTFITRDAIVSALNSTFNVASGQDATVVSVYQNRLAINTLRQNTREVVDGLRLTADERVEVSSGLSPVALVRPLIESDKASEWVQENLKKDTIHLAELRQVGLERLKMSAGVLPGQVLYPVKQAKERLLLAFGSGESDLNRQIEMANSRLNEAIILLEQGDDQKAMTALMEYQDLARKVTAAAKMQDAPSTFTRRIITPHQKTLVASLPQDVASTGLVKEALSQTAELLVEDPLERETVRLENAIARLHDVETLLSRGDLEEAKRTLSAYGMSSKNSVSDLLASIEDEEAKREAVGSVISLRDEEADLLGSISRNLAIWGNAADSMVAMVAQVEEGTQAELERMEAIVGPLEDAIVAQRELSAQERRIQEFVDKVNIYKTWQGQSNQISRLLKYEAENTSGMDFLVALRDSGRLDQRAIDLINAKIAALEAKSKLQKHRAMQRKIDRAIRSR